MGVCVCVDERPIRAGSWVGDETPSTNGVTGRCGGDAGGLTCAEDEGPKKTQKKTTNGGNAKKERKDNETKGIRKKYSDSPVVDLENGESRILG